MPERFQGPKMAPKTAQDRPKTGPRSSWIVFLPLDFSLRFWIAFGSALVSFWVPKWSPREYTKLGLGPLGPIQDGLRIVLVRSFLLSCRLGSLFWLSWPPLGIVLGNSWNRFGPLGVIVEPLGACLRVSEVVFGASLVRNLPFFPSSLHFYSPAAYHFPSSLLPLFPSSLLLWLYLTRPCGLRAARLNPPPPEGSERVRIVFEIFFEFLFEFFELKESSQGPRSPHPSSHPIK